MPPIIQTARTLVGEPNSRAISLATKNTACPIIDPTITAMADHRPRARIRPGALLFVTMFECSHALAKAQDKPSLLLRNVTKRQTNRAREKATLPLFETALVLVRL